MIVLAWIFGYILTYFVIGLAVAAWDMPRLHQRLKDSTEYRNKSWQTRAEEARYAGFATVVFWPLRFPYLLTVRIADKHNPALIQRELARREQEVAEREDYIRKLERINEVGQDKTKR